MSKEIRFTQTWAENLKTPATRTVYRDSKTDGLVIVVQPTGKKTFAWYRKLNGKATWKNIGNMPDFCYEDARAKALEYNSKMAKGEDPFQNSGDVTLGDAFQTYSDEQLTEHSKNPTRAVKDAKQLFDANLGTWKERKLSTIKDGDVAALQRALRKKHSTWVSNRAMQLLRATINFAINRKPPLWKGANPAAGIKLYDEPSRTRFAQPDEMKNIVEKLNEEGNLDLRDFVLLALTTGARRGDIFTMRWADLNQNADGKRFWTVPDPKNNQPYNVGLNAVALWVLKSRKERKKKSEWVFPSRGKSGHLVTLKKSWARFRTQVNAPGLRVHDLRRTLGSWMAGSGASLPIIGKSLGHQSSAATEIYSRLNLDPVSAAVNTAVDAMGLQKLLPA